MSRQANGTYLQPAATAAVSGSTISSTAFNTLITDVGTEITNSVDRLGRSAMQAALPMGGNKITGAADPTVATDAATKNYVDLIVAAFFSTGDAKLTYKTTPDTGWLMMNDTTFGSTGSGATTADNSTQALFTLFFNMSDADVPIFTSGGGATTRAGQVSAANAWAANCRMSLPKTAGRALAGAGAGSGLTSRALGAALGEETHLLATSELPSHTHGNTLTDPGHGHALKVKVGSGNGTQNYIVNNGGVSLSVDSNTTLPGGADGLPCANNFTGISINNAAQGGGTSHNIMQPSAFMNVMVKK